MLARYRDVPAHQLAELAADRQAQARATELPIRRSVSLGEGLKEFAELLRGHPDAGVLDGESDQ